MKNERVSLADGCRVAGSDGVEQLDCTVRLYRLLRQNGYDRIEQVTAQPGMAFFNIVGIGMKALKELFIRLDFLGLRLADWPQEQSVDEYYVQFEIANKERWKRIMEQDDD
jgi:DNA-directed RNA polymerase alpha subunit